MRHPNRSARVALMVAKRVHKDLGGEIKPNEQGLYSGAAQSALSLPQMKGSPQQMIASLKGVKPAELQHSGVQQAFAHQPLVTKHELAHHFQSSMPKIQETTIGGVRPEHHTVSSAASRYPPARFDTEHEAQAELARRQAEEPHGYHHLSLLPTAESRPKFEKYTIPGGTNYRETLLHLPEQKTTKPYEQWLHENFTGEDNPHAREMYAMQLEPGQNYKSSHWDTPNVLAHLRMSDRELPGGKKALHLEELQSDWGQEGRKRGFKKEPITPDQIEARFIPPSVPEGHNPENYPGYWETYDKNTGRMISRHHGGSGESKVIGEAMAMENAERSKMTPTAPYVTKTEGWTDLGLKRALTEAARGNYDKLIWTPGEDQAERYDLSKHIKALHYTPTANGESYLLGPETHEGHEVPVNNGQPIPKDKLADYVGKEAADKILKGEGTASGDVRTLTGLDLKVGGEGMKGYYDNILPKRLLALVKEHDPEAALGTQEIGSGELYPSNIHTLEGQRISKEPKRTFPALTITPKLREGILKRGFKAFAYGGEVPDSPIVGKALEVVRRSLRPNHIRYK